MRIVTTLTRSIATVVTLLALLVACDNQPNGPAAVNCPDPVPGDGMTLVTPNGCESYRIGDTMRITWDVDSVKTAQVISFSPDDGLTHIIIGKVVASAPEYEHGPFVWAVPDSVFSDDGFVRMSTRSDQCRIRIYDYWASYLKDESDVAFSIAAR